MPRSIADRSLVIENKGTIILLRMMTPSNEEEEYYFYFKKKATDGETKDGSERGKTNNPAVGGSDWWPLSANQRVNRRCASIGTLDDRTGTDVWIMILFSAIFHFFFLKKKNVSRTNKEKVKRK